MVHVIDKDEAIALLERAVAEKGADYVDPNAGNDDNGCQYADLDGNPLCIIGHVISYLDIPLEPGTFQNETTDEDYSDQTAPFADGISAVTLFDRYASRMAVRVTDSALSAFATAQTIQDEGSTWGEALEVAKNA